LGRTDREGGPGRDEGFGGRRAAETPGAPALRTALGEEDVARERKSFRFCAHYDPRAVEIEDESFDGAPERPPIRVEDASNRHLVDTTRWTRASIPSIAKRPSASDCVLDATTSSFRWAHTSA
jgi:hypothetical protein